MSAGIARMLEQLRRQGDRTVVLGSITPNLPPLSLGDAAELLSGLVAVNLAQLKRGVPGIDAGIKAGRIRFIRDSVWRPLSSIWANGGGDCKVISPAIAAELIHGGVAARPVVYRVRPGLAHCVVQLLDPRYRHVRRGSLFGHPVVGPGLIDPNRTAGMGGDG